MTATAATLKRTATETWYTIRRSAIVKTQARNNDLECFVGYSPSVQDLLLVGNGVIRGPNGPNNARQVEEAHGVGDSFSESFLRKVLRKVSFAAINVSTHVRYRREMIRRGAK
jgi:hypothetical protein